MVEADKFGDGILERWNINMAVKVPP